MGSFRVLVVEDDVDSMTLLRLALREMPLEIFHAGTGGEAVAYLDRAHPDLVFIDLNLPDMRGWEVVERLKTAALAQRTRIIVLTAHAEPVNRLIGTLQPLTAYLNKPVQQDRLRAAVREALSLA
ncbi:MAG: response regulator [Anaerolineales bacterium]|nr:response regulator [Anaerolineales bacterium]